MTVYSSANGWTANRITDTKVYRVPGTTLDIRLRSGAAGEMLVDFLRWFNTYVEPLDGGQRDDWGYAERPIRGADDDDLSNHASGTACDANALRHPLGARGTFTAAKEERIRRHLRLYEGCIRWGGDYVKRADEMHFEINKDPATVARVWKKLREDWLAMSTIEEVEVLIRKVVREEIARGLDLTVDSSTVPRVDGESGVRKVRGILTNIERLAAAAAAK